MLKTLASAEFDASMEGTGWSFGLGMGQITHVEVAYCPEIEASILPKTRN
jgi:hypothetical protein